MFFFVFSVFVGVVFFFGVLVGLVGLLVFWLVCLVFRWFGGFGRFVGVLVGLVGF